MSSFNRHLNYKSLLLCLVLLFTCSAAPDSLRNFTAKVVGIKDGDTIVVLKENRQIVIRLADIDCPEKNQPYGKAAKSVCSDLCYGRTVRIASDGRPDRFKRLVAYVYTDRGMSLNEQLLLRGYAWHFVKYSSSHQLAQLEARARKSRSGLWADPYPVPPWEWRKRKG